ncbi:MAG: AAA family ATPase, partial [Coriobacteriales bacterium]|nr:AAA family ATPase [Coriobacteriales bacterium]
SAQDTQLISYWTDNPRTDTFKEELLLRGIKVTEAASGDEIFGIILDIFFFVIIVGSIVALAGRLVSFDRTTFKLVHKTGVTFDDIAGMDALKRELGHVVDVLKNPQKYSSRGMRPIKGIVLEGPPGNGKTLFAKALASEAGVNFIATKGADFQSALMSLGARKIRMLFRKAARHTPCIIFIDEFDAIGERRSYAGTGIDKENNRIITAMLNEMDGFTSHDGILVIAATNSYASLDAALVRPGRFDLHYTVGNPDLATRKQLVQIYTAQKTLSPDLTTDALAEKFSGLSCAAIESVLNEAATLAALEDSAQINPTHIEHAAKRVGIKI